MTLRSDPDRSPARSGRVVLALAAPLLAGALYAAVTSRADADPLASDGVIAFQLYGERSAPDDGVWLVNPDGTGLHRLPHQRPVSAAPRWSPDGKTLLVLAVGTSATSLYTIRPDGSGARTVLTARSANLMPGYADWSPTGKEIAVIRGRPCNQLVCDARLDVLSLGTGRLRTVMTGVLGLSPPAWSPDGATIAFVRARDRALCSVALDSGRVRLLAAGTPLAVYPDWSPDGARLGFTRVDPTYGTAYIAAADGGNPRRAVRRDDHGLSWSPDGKRFAFARGSENGDIYVADSDGRRVTRLTRDPRDETFADWGSAAR